MSKISEESIVRNNLTMAFLAINRAYDHEKNVGYCIEYSKIKDSLEQVMNDKGIKNTKAGQRTQCIDCGGFFVARYDNQQRCGSRHCRAKEGMLYDQKINT